MFDKMGTWTGTVTWRALGNDKTTEAFSGSNFTSAFKFWSPASVQQKILNKHWFAILKSEFVIILEDSAYHVYNFWNDDSIEDHLALQEFYPKI